MIGLGLTRVRRSSVGRNLPLQKLCFAFLLCRSVVAVMQAAESCLRSHSTTSH
jgi:hypothetical protein